MSKRSDIFERIRERLGRGPLDSAQRNELEMDMQKHQTGVYPLRARGDRDQHLARFQEMLDYAGTPCTLCEDWASASARISELLSSNGETRVFVAPPELGDRLQLSRFDLDLRSGRAVEDERVSITQAVCGVAETGSVLMASSPSVPAMASFLVETHIVVLSQEDLVGSLTDSWTVLRNRYDDMPRHVVWISGASNTGDIEMRFVRGAHGPRTLHIVVIRSTATTPA